MLPRLQMHVVGVVSSVHNYSCTLANCHLQRDAAGHLKGRRTRAAEAGSLGQLCFLRQHFSCLNILQNSRITFSSFFFPEMKKISVFKNYEAGEPTCRLYVKNIAKQVEEKVGGIKPTPSIHDGIFFPELGRARCQKTRLSLSYFL